jgi:hypothetical protein
VSNEKIFYSNDLKIISKNQRETKMRETKTKGNNFFLQLILKKNLLMRE